MRLLQALGQCVPPSSTFRWKGATGPQRCAPSNVKAELRRGKVCGECALRSRQEWVVQREVTRLLMGPDGHVCDLSAFVPQSTVRSSQKGFHRFSIHLPLRRIQSRPSQHECFHFLLRKGRPTVHRRNRDRRRFRRPPCCPTRFAQKVN